MSKEMEELKVALEVMGPALKRVIALHFAAKVSSDGLTLCENAKMIERYFERDTKSDTH